LQRGDLFLELPHKNVGVLVQFTAAMLRLVCLIFPDSLLYHRVDRQVRHYVGGIAKQPGDAPLRVRRTEICKHLGEVTDACADEIASPPVMHDICPALCLFVEKLQVRIVRADGSQFAEFLV
jgi:hypothetical protein